MTSVWKRRVRLWRLKHLWAEGNVIHSLLRPFWRFTEFKFNSGMIVKYRASKHLREKTRLLETAGSPFSNVEAAVI